MQDVDDEERARWQGTHGDTDEAVAPDGTRRVTLLADQTRLRRRLRVQAAPRTLFTVAILGNTAAVTTHAATSGHPEIGLGGVMAVLLIGLQISRDRARELEADVRQIEHETAVIGAESAVKAETLFLKHQFELRRYYDQALRQGALVSYLAMKPPWGDAIPPGAADPGESSAPA